MFHLPLLFLGRPEHEVGSNSVSPPNFSAGAGALAWAGRVMPKLAMALETLKSSERYTRFSGASLPIVT